MISKCGRESNVARFRRVSLLGNHVLNGANDFRARDRVHAAEIERTFTKTPGAALPPPGGPGACGGTREDIHERTRGCTRLDAEKGEGPGRAGRCAVVRSI